MRRTYLECSKNDEVEDKKITDQRQLFEKKTIIVRAFQYFFNLKAFNKLFISSEYKKLGFKVP